MAQDKAKDPNGLAAGSLASWANRIYRSQLTHVNVRAMSYTERWREMPDGCAWYRLPLIETTGQCAVCGEPGEMYAMWALLATSTVQFVCLVCDYDLWESSRAAVVRLD